MDKKFILSVALALGSVWIFNYYVMRKAPVTAQGGAVDVGAARELAAGQPVQVPTAEVVYKPLVTNVTFDNARFSAVAQNVVVETKQTVVQLSTNGAVIESLVFKNHRGKDKKPLRTIYAKNVHDELERQQGAFLLSIGDKTPFNYVLESKQDRLGGVEVVFAADTEQYHVTKTFVFHHNSYRCDVSIMLDPKHVGLTVTPRLFFPVPFVKEISDDAMTICAWDEAKQSVETHEPAASQGLAWFWLDKKPIFGGQDRFFAHLLVNDVNKFTQRGYIKRCDSTTLLSILEGPATTKKTAWQLSFYLGPKEPASLQAVDERLTPLLSFGWFTSICMLLLKLLAYLYSLIGNFGIAIIVLTIVLRLPFSPLMIYSRKKTDHFAKFEPSITRIKMKYRHDKNMEYQELMKFYKDHDLSPASQMAGCLPQLVQLPILFALFRILNNYIDLYQAPFAGWIVDLSARDPYYILPLLVGLAMIWSNSLMAVVDEKKRVMTTFLAFVVAAVFATFPAGVVLYQLTSNLLGIAEDYVRRIFFNK
jgi:YidC/Oxa1 family membrane protein insertase